MWVLPLFLLARAVDSRSSGLLSTNDINVGGCDWEAPNTKTQWGCQGDRWNASNDFPFARGFCQDANFNGGKFMWWTGKPKNAPAGLYSFRTGNGDPSKDPSSYVPDRYVSIYIKVLKFDQLYKGLLMFAKNSTGGKVGDWNLPWEASPQFAVTPLHICTRSVMHLNAEDKPYVAKFNFLAPPAGTGTIKIKAILKTGPPNPTDFGDFLILPDITLTEQPANDNRKWVLLNGTSCADYCASNGQPPCSDVALSTSMDGIQPNPLDSIYPCHGALFHDCSGNPRVQLPERFCTYAPPSGCASSAAKCTTVPDANTPMFCICGAPITGSPTSAPTVPGQQVPSPQLGGSSRLAPGLSGLIALLSMGAWSSRSQFFWVFVALFFVAAPLANAHNWMEGTRGRASNLGANQFCSPAFPQVNRQKVHMQVAIEQNFIVEWASAHGDYTYWIIIHDDARSNVSKLTRSVMDSWLNGCPGGGWLNATGTFGKKYHRFRPNKNLQSLSPVNGASTNIENYNQTFYPDPIFNGSVWDMFSLNGGRPTTFYSASPGMINCNSNLKDAEHIWPFNCSLYPKSMLAQYREGDRINRDRGCSYVNSTYPWIHTIHRYFHTDVSDGYATAQMKVPEIGTRGAGRYQLHYKWSSYCDTIDIDVKAKGANVVNPYGVAIDPADIEYDVAHHCWFERPRKIGQCVEVVTSPKQCEALCNKDTNCRGFQMLPLQLDNSQGENFGMFPESSFIPWNANLSDTYSFCHKSQFAKAPKQGASVCFPIIQFQNDFNSARPLWSFTDDTNHQGFYGTCYIKPTLRDFGTVAKVSADTHTETRFLSKCIPCDNIGQDLSNPRWGPQLDYCTDCSKNPVTPRQGPQIPTWTTIGPGTFTQTSYWLSPAGSPYAFEDECKVLAQRDSRCSKYVMYSDFRARRLGGELNGTRPSDIVVGSVRFVNTTGQWHYSQMENAYFRTCACLAKNVSDSLAGALPTIDLNMTSYACTNITQANCVFRNFSIFKLP